MISQMGRRFIALALMISMSMFLLTGVSTVAFAANPSVKIGNAVYAFLCDRVGIPTLGESLSKAVDFTFDYKDQVSPAELQEAWKAYNEGQWFRRLFASYPDTWETIKGIYSYSVENRVPDELHAVLESDSAQNNIMRLKIPGVGWLVDVNGNYPYCSKAAWEEFKTGSGSGRDDVTPTAPATYKWVAGRALSSAASISLVTESTLGTIAAELVKEKYSVTLTQVDIKGTKYNAIRQTEATPAGFYLFATDSKGAPIVAVVEPDKQAANQSRPPVLVENVDGSQVNVDSEITNDNSTNKLFDLSNGTLTIVNENGDKINKFLSDLTFNFEDNSYTANTYDYTYNTENNYYELNYYTYNIQYTYNNTYVTYIGSTAEYQPKEWALYYELPDGRSSADLTEADIAGLSFQFADVCNYKRSATDTSLRALYHFDGNTEDSSFFSTQGSFTWNKGASITYMESNAFNGTLYLDEKEHEFVITLPSGIGSQDFSLQWRYYQNSATTTDHNDNYVMIGSTKLLGWSEQSLYSLGTTKLSTGLSVGTWQELALVRQSGTLYLYHNGVRIGSASMSTSFNHKITFHLGSSSRAYSMIDELRFVNFPVVKNGAAYTPTAVPYDTNSVLVLPGGATPVADAYWKWDTTIKPVMALDLTAGDVLPVSMSSGIGILSHCPYVWELGKLVKGNVVASSTYNFIYTGSSYLLSRSATGTETLDFREGYLGAKVGFFGIALDKLYSDKTITSSSLLYSSKTYTASVVTSDGSIYSVTGTLGRSPWNAQSYSQSYPWGTLSLNKSYASNDEETRDYWWPYIRLSLNNGQSLDIVRIELVVGSQANTGHEYVTCLYDPTELQSNTAAIQSTIPVNGYTVGGVRPTFPVRGDVWFPVEGSRISGVYIYNGQAWEETNARWWTGKRWIPIYAFDLVTLADMWDVGSSTGEDVSPPITSEYSFWNWWQKEWQGFRRWLESIWGSGSGSTPGTGDDPGGNGNLWQNIKDTLLNGLVVLIEALFAVLLTVLQALLGLVTDLLSFLFGFLTETVVGGISSFFSSFADGSLFEVFQPEEGEGAVLPEGIPAVFAFFSGVILALPGELRAILIFGVATLVLLSVFKFMKS